MSDVSLDINLNDTTQLFDASGQPTSAQPAVSGMPDDMAEFYEALVGSFEDRIQNSPENQAAQLQATAAAELADMLEALDAGVSNNDAGSDGTADPFVQPPLAPGPGDPGYVEPPPLPPAPPGSPPPPPGSPPPDPYDDIEILDEDADEAFDDTAAAGASIGGAAGGSLFVMATTIDLVISAFEGLQEVINAVDDAMQSVVDDTKSFSGDVAQASAMRDVTDILIKMDRANSVGPDVARWIETRTEIDIVLGKMATDVTQALLPLVQSGTEAILDLLTLVGETGPLLAGLLEQIVSIINAIIPDFISQFGGPLSAALIAIRAGTKAIRDEKIRKMGADAQNAIAGFTQFLMREAMPIQPVGQFGVPQFIGGGLGP